ncbi:MAG: DUF1330 domain-containing protein [Xanthomonadales bacterium]|nr:DUF1330 domain-containing protein [Xanthomonadales bacterium]NIN60553.1 DUF1330 domain-containing protein [Xanthomonadales bacterium]NIN75905.1 DUF1330 domain-containing protein [Xanthomonadales bacterium]NIO14997.1 DUF1330 domain-containing protein [Xanthomonadales bacterium]NIP12946.1 DUF1330 domain-containing protein [Xanthomonadales bacterium]
MAAYMIVTALIHDRERFIEEYGKHAAELVARHGGRYLLLGPGARLLEGDFGAGASMVISEWPDAETALQFWNSPEYTTLKQRREGLADCQVLLIEAPPIGAG